MDNFLIIDDHRVKISNADKLLWPDLGITKVDYIKYLIYLSPYLLSHAKDRFLTTIRYPDGYDKKFFYQKKVPQYAPDFVETCEWKDGSMYINLNNQATLVWLGNLAALEFHTTFNRVQKPNAPINLVFDLDPSRGQVFEQVIDVALKVHETLKKLKVTSYIKTSGATGLQIYIPIGEKYDYDTARSISKFFAEYFAGKYPDMITIERLKEKRGQKLYFDYLQMWEGKSIITPYSPRATKHATIAMPVTWDEVEKGIRPEDFTIINALKRIDEKGDLFANLLSQNNVQNMDFVLEEIK
ncbi:DNA polymerase domain-containing protein [Vallitalea pronyensis]|uniref:DNA polymerase domain-containing protein n=1 Tax=Vallitalea pronyensis TaxID=1348613 RepID=A0A8J8SHM5_9FIRM|nr:non-homologous end-joining DNA ligase [Vallitalea pronyensis]QUI23594.1 DNA polymerase domain-containing protein [Vallitalea pronyensis]